jgi:hypothetical protein
MFVLYLEQFSLTIGHTYDVTRAHQTVNYICVYTPLPIFCMNVPANYCGA